MEEQMNNNAVLRIMPTIVPFIAHLALFIACKVEVSGDWM